MRSNLYNHICVLAIVASLGVTGTAHAAAKKVHPIENFTRSLSAFYVVLKQCSTIARNGNESDIGRIKDYLGKLYPAGVPYWALPVVEKRIEDEDVCSFLMYDRAIAYQQARVNFKKNYPKESAPPEFAVNQPANFYYMDRLLFGDKDRLELEW